MMLWHYIATFIPLFCSVWLVIPYLLQGRLHPICIVYIMFSATADVHKLDCHGSCHLLMFILAGSSVPVRYSNVPGHCVIWELHYTQPEVFLPKAHPSWAHFHCYAFKCDSTRSYRLVTGYRLDFRFHISSIFDFFLGQSGSHILNIFFYPFFMVKLICLITIFYLSSS